MRKTFAKTISELAKYDNRVWLLTADMGYKLFDDFLKERFINVGIAEQNMVGIASGLALCGKIPFCYSISTFLIFRAYEFIRNDVAYQNLPVRLVGCFGPYPNMGISHNCPDEEDINVLLNLPNLSIYNFDVLDKEDLPVLLKESLYTNSPIYFRLPR